VSRIALSPDHGQPVTPTPRKPLTEAQRIELWNRQNGLCGRTGCGKPIPHKGPGVVDEHLVPLNFGDPEANALRNRALLCRACATEKTSKEDVPAIAKAKRRAAKHDGTYRKSSHPLKSRGFQRTLRRRMDGRVEKRNGETS
jgi:5-methylcytosine-specific restriction enzyme A